MPDEKPTQDVQFEVGAEKGRAWLKLMTAGVPPVQIGLDPQAAFEMGEGLARAAHMARFGEAPQSDESYLRDQIRERVTEQLHDHMVTRITHMLKTLRHSAQHNDRKLAQTLVETILQKVV
jgi:hypothetical protein